MERTAVIAASSPLKLLVMGTGPFAVPMFEALRHSPHQILALVTRPVHAAPGRRPPPNPMREAAVAAGLPVLEPDRVNDAESIAATPADAVGERTRRGVQKVGGEKAGECDGFAQHGGETVRAGGVFSGGTGARRCTPRTPRRCDRT